MSRTPAATPSPRERLRRPRDPGLTVITFLLVVWGLVVIYPFYNSILVSLVSSTDYVKNPFMIIPPRIDLESYRFILSSSAILVGYRTSLIILFFGVPLNLAMTVLGAYVLARPRFPGKRVFLFGIVFTMFFSGGIVPVFLVIKTLGLIDSLASIILFHAINTFYLILTKLYFESIPNSIEESARIDGATDFRVLVSIFVPLSMPILATVFLFYLVDRWNEWFFSLLFLRSGNKMPMQVILRRIVVETIAEYFETGYAAERKSFPVGIKMAAIVITMTPIMLIYPFLQKYFVKGIMVGAIKS